MYERKALSFKETAEKMPIQGSLFIFLLLQTFICSKASHLRKRSSPQDQIVQRNLVPFPVAPSELPISIPAIVMADPIKTSPPTFPPFLFINFPTISPTRVPTDTSISSASKVPTLPPSENVHRQGQENDPPTMKSSPPTRFTSNTPSQAPIRPTKKPSFAPTVIPSQKPSISMNPSSVYSVSSTASWTYYDSYPKCCKGQANYDPNYPTSECSDYSGCAYVGAFAAIGKRSLKFVQTQNLIAFYDNSDPRGTNFYSTWANKYVSITGTCKGITATFTAIIADTCANSDCNNCCAKNSHPKTGYLIDMEYYTSMRYFGTGECAAGGEFHNVSFSFSLGQEPAIPNCGAGIGGCSGPNQCCSSDGYCGYTDDYCGKGCQNSYGNCGTRSPSPAPTFTPTKLSPSPTINTIPSNPTRAPTRTPTRWQSKAPTLLSPSRWPSRSPTAKK